jgi:hypothetical protein
MFDGSLQNALPLHAWQDRLAPIVSRKLGCKATFRGFTRSDKVGAVTPIFTVPLEFRATAESLGLLIA